MGRSLSTPPIIIFGVAARASAQARPADYRKLVQPGYVDRRRGYAAVAVCSQQCQSSAAVETVTVPTSRRLRSRQSSSQTIHAHPPP
jgi:hypothetical protein